MQFTKVFAIISLAAAGANALPTAEADSALIEREAAAKVSAQSATAAIKTVLSTINQILPIIKSSTSTLSGQAVDILSDTISELNGLLA